MINVCNIFRAVLVLVLLCSVNAIAFAPFSRTSSSQQFGGAYLERSIGPDWNGELNNGAIRTGGPYFHNVMVYLGTSSTNRARLRITFDGYRDYFYGSVTGANIPSSMSVKGHAVLQYSLKYLVDNHVAGKIKIYMKFSDNDFIIHLQDPDGRDIGMIQVTKPASTNGFARGSGRFYR